MKDNLKILDYLEINRQSLSGIVPEIIICACFILVVIFDLVYDKRRNYAAHFIALTGLFIALVVVWQKFPGEDEVLFTGMFRSGPFYLAVRGFFILSGIVAVIYSIVSGFSNSLKVTGEFLGLLLLIILGCNFFVSAGNLLILFIALEMISLSQYALAGFNFNSLSAEGSLKYFLFGAFSSAITLYGISVLFLSMGTFYPELFAGVTDPVAGWGYFLLVAGILFKISAFPYHFWAPDVYEGAPYPVIAFFSIAPKAAGVIVLFTLSLFFTEAVGAVVDIKLFLTVIAALTLTVGNLAAVWQKNVKRLLAYSAIAHSGFLLAGLVPLSSFSLQAVLFYLFIYLLMNFVAFMAVEVLVKISGSGEIKSFSGIGKRVPWLGVAVVIIMIALTGLPPTAGFTAKLLLFGALWEAFTSTGSDYVLFILFFSVLNAVVALFYYLKIPYIMFFKDRVAGTGKIKIKAEQQIFIGTGVFLVVLLFFMPGWVYDFISSLNLNLLAEFYD